MHNCIILQSLKFLPILVVQVKKLSKFLIKCLYLHSYFIILGNNLTALLFWNVPPGLLNLDLTSNIFSQSGLQFVCISTECDTLLKYLSLKI